MGSAKKPVSGLPSSGICLWSSSNGSQFAVHDQYTAAHLLTFLSRTSLTPLFHRTKTPKAYSQPRNSDRLGLQAERSSTQAIWVIVKSSSNVGSGQAKTCDLTPGCAFAGVVCKVSSSISVNRLIKIGRSTLPSRVRGGVLPKIS